MSIIALKIPPLIVVIVIAVGMMVINILWLPGLFSYPFNIIGGLILALAGLASVVLGLITLRRAKTTPNPFRPENATTLVTEGIYARTRNPIYLGLLLWLVGLGVYLINPLTFFGPLAFVLYMNRFQIRPEERALKELFGDEFETYKSRVGRWM